MTKRKAYRKPEIKQVELVPEEAVLTNCKTGSGAGRSSVCNFSSAGCTNFAPGS